MGFDLLHQITFFPWLGDTSASSSYQITKSRVARNHHAITEIFKGYQLNSTWSITKMTSDLNRPIINLIIANVSQRLLKLQYTWSTHRHGLSYRYPWSTRLQNYWIYESTRNDCWEWIQPTICPTDVMVNSESHGYQDRGEFWQPS